MVTLRLVDETGVLDEFVLNDDAGIRVGSLDLGHPEPRTASVPNVGQDGDYDSTAYFGGRAVAMQAMALPDLPGAPTKQEIVDRLAAFLHPRRRPYLYYTLEDGGEERRIRLRGDQFTRPLTSPLFQQVQAQWRAPDGVQEAGDLEEQTINAGGESAVESGRPYDLVYDRDYPDTASLGTTIVTNRGNVDVAPVLRLWGPCDDPRIENQATDERFVFDGLSILAGDYVEIDVRERTILHNSDPLDSRYHLLDFAASDWWRLVPGDNTIRFYPVASTPPSFAHIMWRSAWL